MPQPYTVKPDSQFLRRVLDQGGADLKQCFQCATCSAVCELSRDGTPFPRKEMIWAQWGLKDRLLADPDVWLCYQCDDCSTHCPRGARPGDVLAAVRQEVIQEYAVPRFLGRWLSQPRYLPLALLVPVVLLGLAMLLRSPIEGALGISGRTSEKIIYAYSNLLPHWLLISFFGLFTVATVVAMVAGVRRFWGAMRAADPDGQALRPLWPSITAALKDIFLHSHFSRCTTEQGRSLAHLLVFYGFAALSLVAFWVVTAAINPLTPRFAYPFNFWSPWRMLANLGGLAVLAGCGLMIRDRVLRAARGGRSSYADWLLLGTVLAVVLTGLASEAAHYARWDPHRHVIYFIHLVCVFTLLMYLPYSKLAHLVYRATAMVYAIRTGRVRPAEDRGDGEPPAQSG
ncbi:MAG TPA: hypothetical protein EYP56_15175 [Planctomycetaceae bacterium]|nr:hypothetical protein [Planctomycetaceae bacterium]HIQ21220.1 hypothetical protein [Planctomycetota bacterium]